jgi:hypothetical protein
VPLSVLRFELDPQHGHAPLTRMKTIRDLMTLLQQMNAGVIADVGNSPYEQE